MSEEINVTREGAIATITLTRAEKNNTLTTDMLSQLEAIARGFGEDEQTRVVVLRAEGDNFSFGADLEEIGSGTPPSTLKMRRDAELGAQMMRSIRDIHQPTICAIQGISTGGATCIASACDFRIAAENGRMGYGEVKLDINLMWHAVPPCVQLIGPSRAKQMIMSGKLFPVEQLERWGFIDEVCECDSLDAKALEWAREYGALPPIAVQMIKRSINRLCGALDDAVMHADADQWLLATKTRDFHEAVSAFMDKRTPEFKGD